MKRYVISLLVSILICMGLALIVIGVVPQEGIRGSIGRSVEYLEGRGLFPFIREGVFNTRQDNYADAILFNIIYYGDSDNPFHSLLSGMYYNQDGTDVINNLSKAVTDNPKANTEYSRYWHGSMVFIRPLLLFVSIKEIRIILAFFVIVVLCICMWVLVRRGLKGYACCLFVGLLLVKVWMIAYSIEYVMTFIVMAMTLLGVLIVTRDTDSKIVHKRLVSLFAASGVCTCFFDFLTTETLPLTIPLLTVIILSDKSRKLKSWRESLKPTFLYTLIFSCSYGVMFIVKWVLSAIFLDINTYSSTLSSIVERSVGFVNIGNSTLSPKASTLQKLSGAIFRNLGCLFPFKDEMHTKTVLALALGVLILVLSCIYLLHSNKLYKDLGVLIGVVSFIPIVRFLLISNHAYLHYFFTYRALLASVVGVLYYTWVCIREYVIRRFNIERGN